MADIISNIRYQIRRGWHCIVLQQDKNWRIVRARRFNCLAQTQLNSPKLWLPTA